MTISVEFLVDHALACRLERTEATANARFVESRARLMPDSGAQWIEVAGAYAMFDGVRSPCTQTFGLGLFQTPTDEDLSKLESFFLERGAPVFHEVSPLADKSLVPMLNQRGYTPIEFTSVMFLPLVERHDSTGSPGDIRVRIVAGEERDLWARTGAAGWQDETEFSDLILELMRVNAARPDCVAFLAETQGQPIAAGALAIENRVCLLAGASTVSRWRKRGAQKALLQSRLKYAERAGCDLAMVCAAPGSASQRNAERNGFRIAYTRVKFEMTHPGQRA